jgi:hypothetical protein
LIQKLSAFIQQNNVFSRSLDVSIRRKSDDLDVFFQYAISATDCVSLTKANHGQMELYRKMTTTEDSTLFSAEIQLSAEVSRFTAFSSANRHNRFRNKKFCLQIFQYPQKTP